MNTYIEQKYIELGGPTGPLGTAIGEEVNINFGVAYKRYQHAVIFYSPAYGAVFIHVPVFDRWLNLNTVTTADAISVQDYIGFPTEDAIRFEYAEYSYFERGLIVHNIGTGSVYFVYGEVYSKYKLLSDIRGRLGLPINDEQTEATGGTSANFENGVIYWNSLTGAYALSGAIQERYKRLGGPNSSLGFPVSDQEPIRNGTITVGGQTRFQDGIIFWSNATGAFELQGELLVAYQTQFGGPTGVIGIETLGFPTSSQNLSLSGRKMFNNFQHGIIVIDLDEPAPRIGKMITKLDFYVDSFESKGDDTVTANEQDLFVKIKLESNIEGILLEFEFGDRKHSNYQVRSVLKNIRINDGNLVLTASLEGWDDDSGLLGSSPDKLGTVQTIHSIDSLWDIGSTPDWNDSDFLAKYNVRPNWTDFIDITDFRKQLCWKFSNSDPALDTPELSKDQYAQTFTDVHEDEFVIWGWANTIFYELAYKHVAKGGNCFGMCLEALYALNNRSVSNELISQYNIDRTRKNEINVKQGYQLGVDQINFYIDSFFQGRMMDPMRAFNESRDSFLRGDGGVLNMVHFNVHNFGPGINFPTIDTAHAVLPYEWDTRDPNRFVIKIYNPNNPFGTGADTDPGNIIEILNPNNNPVYNFRMGTDSTGAPDIWSGNDTIFSETWLFAAPFSKYASQPQTPVWEALALVFGIIVVIVADNGTADQVTDENDRFFYKKIKGKQLNLDSKTRIPNILKAPSYHSPELRTVTSPESVSTRTSPPEIYFVKKHVNRRNVFAKKPTNNISNPSNPFHLSDSHFAVATSSSHFATHLNMENVIEHFGLNGGETIRSIIGTAKDSKLKFEIKEKNLGGDYRFFFKTANMSIEIKSPAILHANDFVVIEGAGTDGQAVSIVTHKNCIAKKLKILICGFESKTKKESAAFDISNMTVASQHTLTFQLNNGGKELILHNTGPEVIFDMKLSAFNKNITNLPKTNIRIGSNELAIFQPNNTGISNSSINCFILDKMGGNLLSHRIL